MSTALDRHWHAHNGASKHVELTANYERVAPYAVVGNGHRLHVGVSVDDLFLANRINLLQVPLSSYVMSKQANRRLNRLECLHNSPICIHKQFTKINAIKKPNKFNTIWSRL